MISLPEPDRSLHRSIRPGAPATLIALTDPAAGDKRQAGAKAANLARLLAAGFPVPAGVVLTTAAFAAHYAAAGEHPGGRGRAILETPVPGTVAGALLDALTAFGDAPLAVRSSGVAEDLAGASFAGQYETVLGVRGPAAVLDAVRRCWASAFSDHLVAYREARSVEAGGMAVLIQPLIAADAAGVAFTANPVTGDRSETLVSAVRGLGDRLVAGVVNPDEWTVRDGAAFCRSAPEAAVGAGEVLAIAGLAREVEAAMGTPQDIEWAISEGELYLLQARPITGLRATAGGVLVPLPVNPPPGFWERDVTHFPQPITPLFRSFLLDAENRAIRRWFDEASMLLETLELREIGGWVYQRLVPLGGRDRPAPPAWLWPVLLKMVPSLRSRVRRCGAFARAGKSWRFAERWHSEWKPELIECLAALRQQDLGALDDGELGQHISRLTGLFRESFAIHMLVNGAHGLLLADFCFTCRELLGWDEARAMELLTGLSDASSAPARSLAALAARVRENPALEDMLQVIDELTAARMASVDPAFGAEFDRHLTVFGCRVIRYELVDRTVGESPEWVLALLRDQLRRGYDPAADATALAERRTCSCRGGAGCPGPPAGGRPGTLRTGAGQSRAGVPAAGRARLIRLQPARGVDALRRLGAGTTAGRAGADRPSGRCVLPRVGGGR